MSRSRLLGTLATMAAAVALTRTAQAGAQTYVSLAGRDDAIPKLGRPGIAVHVDAPDADDAALLSADLARALARQVHTRPLAPSESGDYDLEVRVAAPRVIGTLTTVPFEAMLKSSHGDRLWRIEGRTDVEGAPVDTSILSGIGRNVVAALIHDGWVQPRYDPDDPPPQAPRIRSE